MKIKFLKAGTGDCILINVNSKNILIDGGNESTFLKIEYNEIIGRGEKIDLLIVTHHDDDHIKGILDLFKEIELKEENPLIHTIIFNSPRKILNTIKVAEQSNSLSYKQSYELEQYLIKNSDIKWITSLEEEELAAIRNYFLEKDLQDIEIFSPSKETLLNYASNKGAYLSSDYRNDWEAPSLAVLNKSLSDKSQDTSSSNKTSIVVNLKYKNKNYLFTGDITPKELEPIIDKLKGDNDVIKFDLVKLSHHGSYRSLNNKLLSKIDCSKFIISTNSRKYYLPNKRALLKIINCRVENKKISFLFNYGEVIPNLRITKSEMQTYNFELVCNNEKEGYVVDI